MDDFAILTNRKRALIALAHSIVFLAIALRGFASLKQALWLAPSLTLGAALLLIYLTVGSILAWLTCVSRCARSGLTLHFAPAARPSVSSALCLAMPHSLRRNIFAS